MNHNNISAASFVAAYLYIDTQKRYSRASGQGKTKSFPDDINILAATARV